MTLTGLGACATALAVRKCPADRAKSRTALARQCPRRSPVPLASTTSPLGAVTVASKSAVGEVDASPRPAGGSVAQPIPGSQASSG